MIGVAFLVVNAKVARSSTGNPMYISLLTSISYKLWTVYLAGWLTPTRFVPFRRATRNGDLEPTPRNHRHVPCCNCVQSTRFAPTTHHAPSNPFFHHHLKLHHSLYLATSLRLATFYSSQHCDFGREKKQDVLVTETATIAEVVHWPP